jgi:hypothetical protein
MKRALVLCVLLLASSTAWAGPIFRWVDARGDLHLTDELTEVPEPYQSMYRARLREREEAEKRAREAAAQASTGAAPATPSVRPSMPPASGADDPGARPVSPAGGDARRTAGGDVTSGAMDAPPSPSEQEAARRSQWKELVGRWRLQLATSTDDLVRIDERLGSLQANAILAQTPEVQGEIADLQAERRQALSRVDAARRMLVVELPAKARRELVPPAWLQ